MKNTFKILLSIFTIVLCSLLFNSCGKDTNPKNKIVSENGTQKKGYKDLINAKIEFPDTVYINKTYNGRLKYFGLLDTITTTVTKEINGVDRYIIFSLTKTKNIDYDIEELRKKKLDTFGAIDNNTIPFYHIKFTKIGTNYIYGIINDHVTIDTLKRVKKADDKVRYIENESRISHKVFVIKDDKRK